MFYVGGKEEEDDTHLVLSNGGFLNGYFYSDVGNK